MRVKRRDVLALIAGAMGLPAAGPTATRAQQGERLRRVGVLYSVAETDVEGRAWDAAFRKRLDELGWTDGRNVRLDYR
jgi:putative ABC transport system substrate-binding protein